MMPSRLVRTFLAVAASAGLAPAADPAPLPALPDAPAAVDLPSPLAFPDATGACASPLGCAPAAPLSCLCGPPGRAWVSAEWLYWASSGNPLPPLVTASPAGTPAVAAGVPLRPGTATLFGGDRVGNQFRSGFRLGVGAWLDDCQRCGVYGDFFFLGRASNSFTAGSADGSAAVARPFFNPLSNAPDSQIVSLPGVASGFVTADAYTDVIGFGAGFIKNLCCDPCLGRVDLTVGYRYLGVTDDLTITETPSRFARTSAVDGRAVPVPAAAYAIRDHFRAENHFHGPAVGLTGERRSGRNFVSGNVSLAMGVNHQVLTVDGSTVVTNPATGAVLATGPGGLLTAPSNIGTYTRNRFAVVPEVGVRVGRNVTDNVRAFVGYNFIYLSNVTRSGDMVDLRVNPNQLVPATNPVTGPRLPAFNPPTTDFWLQGISVGAEYRFF